MGVWRWRDRKFRCVKQGDLLETEAVFMLPPSNRRAGRAGVRASIVAMKSRNWDGAKGTQEGGYVTRTQRRKANQRKCLKRLSKLERSGTDGTGSNRAYGRSGC